MNVWGLSFPFFLLSTALAVALTRWTPKRNLGEATSLSFTPTPLIHRLALVLLGASPIVLSYVVAWTLERTALHGASRTTLFYAAVAATLAPQLLLHSFLTWALFRRGFFTAASLPHDRVRVGSRVAMGVVILATVSFITLYLTLGPAVEAYAPVALALCLSMVAILAAGRWAGYADQGRPQEMEESPLRNEILSIARAFGWAPKSLRIYKVRRDDLGPTEKDVLQGLDQWRTDFNPLRPALPAELVRDTDPAAITAGMAMRYAHAVLLNPFRIPALQLGPVRLPGMLLALLALFVTGVPVFLLLYGAGEPAPEALMGAYWFVMLIAFVASLIAIQVRKNRFHLYAYKAWESADPAKTRTPAEFVAALALYDRAMKHVQEPERILARLERDRGLSHFLTLYQIELLDALTAARSALASAK